MPRHSFTRKYRPAFEALEPKQLLSAGPPTRGPEILVQAASPVSTQADYGTINLCGTGKSIRIITSS